MHVVNALLEQGRSVRVLARNGPKARALFGDRVELVVADLTRPDAAFRAAFQDVGDVVFTAAVPPRPAGEALIKAVDHDGLVAALEAARAASITGRFLYMNTMGKEHRTLPMRVLNLIKRGISRWRIAAEQAIRSSGLPYVIVRASMLTNKPAGRSPLSITPGDAPLRFSMKVARADVARVFACAVADKGLRKVELSVTNGTGIGDIATQLAACQQPVQAQV